MGRAASGPLQLRQVFSWLSIGPAVSNFIGPFTAGLLIDHAGAAPGSLEGYRAAFFLMAVLPIASWFLVQRTRELPPVIAATGGVQPKAWDLLREPTFRRLMLVNWFLSSCWDVHTFVVPVLGFERGISASVIGSILGAFAIAAAVIRMVMPLLAAHLREWRVLAGAMLATAALFCNLPADAVGAGHGHLLGVAGFCPWHSAAHDHEHAAPDHSRSPPRRGAGAAVDGDQRLQCADAHAVWFRRRPGGHCGRFLGHWCAGGGRFARGLAAPVQPAAP
ncbi:MFS transporter [Polaromonas sp. P1(28)-8]|nr:MFS transporter [Polaromonas sp. P1(28)-8]